MHIVLITSLSHDPILAGFTDPAKAREHMRKELVKSDWPEDAAAEAAAKGSPVLLADDGDSSEIRILNVVAQD